MTALQPLTKTIAITGASSGIGQSCALRLDRLGFRVFAGVRRQVDGEALCRQASYRLTPVLLDITDAASIAAAVETITAATGESGLAGLVNNAGIAVAGPLEFLPVSEIRRQFEVNILGQIAVTQAFLPLLRQGRGRVVTIGSVGGRVAMPFIGPYCAAKFALEALTDSLRIELRPWHIPVTIIEPGFIATPIWEKSKQEAENILHTLSPQVQQLYDKAIPAARAAYSRAGQTGTPPEEVAKVVARALAAKRPKTRYTVGRGSRFGATVLARLPDRLRDTLISWWLR